VLSASVMRAMTPCTDDGDSRPTSETSVSFYQSTVSRKTVSLLLITVHANRPSVLTSNRNVVDGIC
jgi:hypothetical protein